MVPATAWEERARKTMSLKAMILWLENPPYYAEYHKLMAKRCPLGSTSTTRPKIGFCAE